MPTQFSERKETLLFSETYTNCPSDFNQILDKGMAFLVACLSCVFGYPGLTPAGAIVFV